MPCEKCLAQACCGCEEISDMCPCETVCHEAEQAQRERDDLLLAHYRTLADAVKRTQLTFGSPIALELARIDKLEVEAQKLSAKKI